MSSTDRLVFTFALGKREFGHMAMGLGRSLQYLGDTAKRAILTDLKDFPWSECFDIVLSAESGFTGAEKLRALERLEAKQILALDADMLAFKRLDDIFEACQGRNLCVQGGWRKEGTWWGTPFEKIMQTLGVDVLPRFNGGMIYCEDTPAARAILADAVRAMETFDATGFNPNRHGRPSEELSLLISLLKHPGEWTLIPDRLQFQNSLSGPMFDAEIDILRSICSGVCRQERLRRAEPYLFHAYFYRYFLVYWNQIRKLEKWAKEGREPPRLFREAKRERGLEVRVPDALLRPSFFGSRPPTLSDSTPNRAVITYARDEHELIAAQGLARSLYLIEDCHPKVLISELAAREPFSAYSSSFDLVLEPSDLSVLDRFEALLLVRPACLALKRLDDVFEGSEARSDWCFLASGEDRLEQTAGFLINTAPSRVGLTPATKLLERGGYRIDILRGASPGQNSERIYLAFFANASADAEYKSQLDALERAFEFESSVPPGYRSRRNKRRRSIQRRLLRLLGWNN